MRFWKYGIAALMIGALRGVDCFVTTTTTTKGVNFMPETCLWSKTRLYGMRVTIRIVGRKGSEKWIEDGCNMYIQRLKPANIELNTEWHKSNDNLVKGVQADWSKNIPVVMLDPKGKRLSSESFSSDIYRLLEKGGSRLVYVIGGVSTFALLGPPFVLASCLRSCYTFLHRPKGYRMN